jgi:hydrogenase maturation protein HypF
MPVPDMVAALVAGRIVAIKGVGGYHLACDARDPVAVPTLRARKQRGDKPFAVMVADVATAERIAVVDDAARGLLLGPARPIVLVPARDHALQEAVAPGNTLVGVMLPYTPLHHLLFDAGAPEVLVMTSGNLSDEPICIDPREAEERLADLADVFCHHDRRIQVACDDSVLRVVAGQPQPVRRSRGFVPHPITVTVDLPATVAVGGEIKATAAVATGDRVWLTQHIGDVEDLQTLDMLARAIGVLSEVQRIDPEVVVSDAHPGYLSRGWAARFAQARGIEHVTVQHHHAHLASLLAEHLVPVAEPVLGVVFDGTGYGTDGTIWGGELLLGSYRQVQRVGHLKPVSLPGGDAAVRFPGRVALAHLHSAGLAWEATAAAEQMPAADRRLLEQMLRTGSHCTPTTSMGRLFDAVAALLDVRQSVDYEAQAAIELEALAAAADAAAWPVAVGWEADRVVIDPAGWLRLALDATDTAAAARSFHLAVADAVVESAALIRERHGVLKVGLTGGVFANAVLTSACVTGLRAAGFTVLTHRLVPPNDGGLALGQVCVAGVNRLDG